MLYINDSAWRIHQYQSRWKLRCHRLCNKAIIKKLIVFPIIYRDILCILVTSRFQRCHFTTLTFASADPPPFFNFATIKPPCCKTNSLIRKHFRFEVFEKTSLSCLIPKSCLNSYSSFVFVSLVFHLGKIYQSDTVQVSTAAQRGGFHPLPTLFNTIRLLINR